MTQIVRIPETEAFSLAYTNLIRAGATEETASSVAHACVDAQKEGKSAHGLGHVNIYCRALKEGRAKIKPESSLHWRTPVLASADADGGIPHPLFDQAFDDLVYASQKFGLAMFGLKGGFTCGALGYFTRRLANERLLALAFTNGGPAVVAGSGSTKSVYCTNPLAFAVPQQEGPPLSIDQATSESALMKIREAHANGKEIPGHWALDAKGNPTTDPEKALGGMLLAFGGSRGANIALMVELMAAGLNGAQWSVDAPSFAEGNQNLLVGLTVIAFNPELTFGTDFLIRTRRYFDRLASFSVYLPGIKSNNTRRQSEELGIPVELDLLESLRTQIR